MATANSTVTLCIFVGHLPRGTKESHAVLFRVDGVLAGYCRGYKRIQFRLSPLCISGQFGQTDPLIYPEDGGSSFVRKVGNTAYLGTFIITDSHNRNHHR